MKITKTLENTTLNIALEGRLDTVTAPELEAELKASLSGITELNFDFKDLQYISSAGLRVLLSARKTVGNAAAVVIHNASEEVKEVFEITGFSDILTIA